MAQNDIIVPREGANNVLTEIVLADATTSARGLLSASDKTKLDGIAAGAEVNANADWNASSGDAQILNKPTLGTAAAAATTDFAAASHTHAASAITSGVLNNARVNFAAPPAIGAQTPNTGAFTNLWAMSRLNLPSASGDTLNDIWVSNGQVRYQSGIQVTSARTLLTAEDNLSTLTNAATARANLGLGGWATLSDGATLRSEILTISDGESLDYIQLTAGSGVIFNGNRAAQFRGALGLGTSDNVTFGSLTANNGTLTASAPALNIEQTWNGAGVNFIAAQINAIRASGNSSSADAELLRLSENGTEVFRFRRTGQIVASSLTLTATTGNIAIGSNAFWFGGAGSAPSLTNGGTSTALDLRNQANAMDFRIYGQYTTASNFERLSLKYNSTATAFQIGTEKGSGGGLAKALQFQVDGTTRFQITSSGALGLGSVITVWENTAGMYISSSGAGINFNNGVTISANGGFENGSGGRFRWKDAALVPNGNHDLGFQRNSAGVLEINNGTAGTFRDVVVRMLDVGGTTNAFPALKNSSTTLQVRLADDTAFAPLECAGLTLNGNLTASTRNIVTDTTTGTRIGTAPDQKIGFWNATPAIRPAAVADATDAATVITQLNALLSRLRTIGLIAT